MMRNKKAQIGATITWLVAILIIFFIMLVYILVAMGLAAKKGSSEDIVQKMNSENIALNTELMSILNSDISSDKTFIEEIKSLVDSASKDIPENLKTSAEKILGRVCRGYLFNIINIEDGLIYPRDIDNFPTIQFNVDFPPEAFTRQINLNIPYKSQIIKLKYERLKECEI